MPDRFEDFWGDEPDGSGSPGDGEVMAFEHKPAPMQRRGSWLEDAPASSSPPRNPNPGGRFQERSLRADGPTDDEFEDLENLEQFDDDVGGLGGLGGSLGRQRSVGFGPMGGGLGGLSDEEDEGDSYSPPPSRHASSFASSHPKQGPPSPAVQERQRHGLYREEEREERDHRLYREERVEEERRERLEERVEERPQRVEERPQRVEERPQRVEERPQRVEERPQRVEERPQREDRGRSQQRSSPARSGSPVGGGSSPSPIRTPTRHQTPPTTGAQEVSQEVPGAQGLPPRVPVSLPEPAAAVDQSAGHEAAGVIVVRPPPLVPQQLLKYRVVAEGWLSKKAGSGVLRKRWHKRYFVLLEGPNELRYYKNMVDSRFGPVPLHELGCVPVHLIHRITSPADSKPPGCRFDIEFETHGSRHYACEDEEDEAGGHGGQGISKTLTYCLRAAKPQGRMDWVTSLSAFATEHGGMKMPAPTTATTAVASTTEDRQRAGRRGSGASSTAMVESRRKSRTPDRPGRDRGEEKKEREGKRRSPARRERSPSPEAGPGPKRGPSGTDAKLEALYQSVAACLDHCEDHLTVDLYVAAPTQRIVTDLLEELRETRQGMDAKDVVEAWHANRPLSAHDAAATALELLRQLQAPLLTFQGQTAVLAAADLELTPRESKRKVMAAVSELSHQRRTLLLRLLVHWKAVIDMSASAGGAARVLSGAYGSVLVWRTPQVPADKRSIRLIFDALLMTAEEMFDEWLSASAS